VDVMVLLYDLHRWETLERLESYWLPMIQEVHQDKVNKLSVSRNRN
jgi:hypothetical protein